MERPVIIAVDFDGTICENVFPAIGPIRQNCIELLKHFRSQGMVIILWTCRTGQALTDALEFCNQHGFQPDSVNENWAGLPFETSHKIYADFYIDDKSLSHEWEQIVPKILNFEKDAFIITE